MAHLESTQSLNENLRRFRDSFLLFHDNQVVNQVYNLLLSDVIILSSHHKTACVRLLCYFELFVISFLTALPLHKLFYNTAHLNIKNPHRFSNWSLSLIPLAVLFYPHDHDPNFTRTLFRWLLCQLIESLFFIWNFEHILSQLNFSLL